MFIFASFIYFQLLNGLSLGIEFGTLPLNFLFSNTLLANFGTFFVQELFMDLYQELVRDS